MASFQIDCRRPSVAAHSVTGPRQWEAKDVDAVRRAQAAALAALDEHLHRAHATTKDDLRDAPLQSILDRLRTGLSVRAVQRRGVIARQAGNAARERQE